VPHLNDRMIRVARAAAVFALLAVTALTVTAAHAKPTFDGTWSVLIVTDEGTCDRAYRYPVHISRGVVSYDGQADFIVSGRVKANGAIAVRVARGDQSANGTGRLAGSAGAGSWRTGECSGTWSAERR
jgi:hypothetical protein